MSHTSLNALHSQPSSPDSSFPDSATLAATLQAVAQAILHHGEQPVPFAVKEGRAVLPDAPAPAGSVEVGEVRSYYFSPSVLKHERDLLKKYRVDDFRGLITETHTLLVGIVKLMKSVHPETRMNGHAVSSLGCLLEQASILTLRMQNVYNRVELRESPATA